MSPWIPMFSKKRVKIVALKVNKDLAYMNELFEAGKIKPLIDGPYTLVEVPKAFGIFARAEHKGKIVITI
jgi:NADPH:quinone reductase-like Zn-dependent oxidoreductase